MCFDNNEIIEENIIEKKTEKFQILLFRPPSDGGLMIPPWTFRDVS